MSETEAPPDVWATFLAARAARQDRRLQRYRVDAEVVWLKKAGRPHPAWRYGALGMLARMLRVPALRPVPNPGGPAAIETEVRRLRELASRGLRVPLLLAAQPDALLMLHAGRADAQTLSLADELDAALSAADGAAVFAVWREGLNAIGAVHAAGACLSQAFARNLVRGADGQIAFIDFEDDPRSVLPLADAQARDILCYAHSSAWHLERAASLEGAASADAPLQALRSWSYAREPAARDALRRAIARLAWLRRLPRGMGRDVERTRSAAALLAALRI